MLNDARLQHRVQNTGPNPGANHAAQSFSRNALRTAPQGQSMTPDVRGNTQSGWQPTGSNLNPAAANRQPQYGSPYYPNSSAVTGLPHPGQLNQHPGFMGSPNSQRPHHSRDPSRNSQGSGHLSSPPTSPVGNRGSDGQASLYSTPYSPTTDSQFRSHDSGNGSHRSHNPRPSYDSAGGASSASISSTQAIYRRHFGPPSEASVDPAYRIDIDSEIYYPDSYYAGSSSDRGSNNWYVDTKYSLIMS